MPFTANDLLDSLVAPPCRRTLPVRLIAVREAAAGRDRDGERSVTIHILADEEYRLRDIRIDANDEPIAELRRCG